MFRPAKCSSSGRLVQEVSFYFLCIHISSLVNGRYVVTCAVPVGNVSWILFQEGRDSNLRLRRTVGHAAHTRNNPHVKCIGVYCAQTVNSADTNELYRVQFLVSWVSPLTLALIVKLHSKLLVTVRDISADCNWSTKQLHIARAINILRDHIQGVPGGMCNTSGGCSLC
jgi:hypothetical protein